MGVGVLIQITPQLRILVAIEAIDGRKGIDSLAQLCREKLDADPFSGCLFIFRSRSGKAIRILAYDGLRNAQKTGLPKKTKSDHVLASHARGSVDFRESVGGPTHSEIDDCGLELLSDLSVPKNRWCMVESIAMVVGRVKILWTLSLFSPAALAASAVPVINPGGILNAASYNIASQAVAPGSIATIFGSNLSNGTTCFGSCGPTFDKNGVLIPTLAGVSVTFNGIAAPVLVVANSGQIDVQVPVEMAGSSSASVVATVNGQSSVPVSVPIQPTAPGIFSANASGSGQGAIVNNRDATSGIVSLSAPWFSLPSAHPAVVGDYLQIYATGLGALSPSLATGTLPKGSAQTATTTTVSIGGVGATVTYAGASGCCVGLDQINVVIPSGVFSNPAVPVVVTVGNQSSNTVTIATGGYMGGLGGTLQSISGAINNNNVARLGLALPPPTGSATGSISFAGSGSTSNGQTAFTLTGSGGGTISSCALNGSNTAAGDWSASSTMTATVSPPVQSRVTTLIGTYSATTSFTVCGAALPPYTVYGGMLGGVSADGTVGLIPIVTSVPGFIPVFSPFNGTVDTGFSGLYGTGNLNNNDPTATGVITLTSSLQSSSDTQAIYAVTVAGNGTASCAPFSGRGNWSLSITSTITLSPPPASLATTGGSVSGQLNGGSGPVSLCGRTLDNPLQLGTPTAIGTVFPGGGMALWIGTKSN